MDRERKLEGRFEKRDATLKYDEAPSQEKFASKKLEEYHDGDRTALGEAAAGYAHSAMLYAQQGATRPAESNYRMAKKLIGLLQKDVSEKAREFKKHRLGKHLTGGVIVAFLGVGTFFLSNNITGNAIADLSTNTTSWVGGVLLVVGLVAGFFWIKRRKKKLVVRKKK